MANPPITIGELTDVPAPGSPIASPWPQEVTRRIMHRFATVTERNAKYPAAAAGAGALSIVTAAPQRIAYSDGTKWVALADWTAPRGVLAVAKSTVAQTGITTPWAALVGLQLDDVLMFATRRYMLSFTVGVLTSGAAAAEARIVNVATGVQATKVTATTGGQAFVQLSGFFIFEPAADNAQTWRVDAQVSAGNMQTTSSATAVAYLIAQDVGATIL
jgi:hypothetical protein